MTNETGTIDRSSTVGSAISISVRRWSARVGRSPRMEPSTGPIRSRLSGFWPARGPGRFRILLTGDGSILDSDQGLAVARTAVWSPGENQHVVTILARRSGPNGSARILFRWLFKRLIASRISDLLLANALSLIVCSVVGAYGLADGGTSEICRGLHHLSRSPASLACHDHLSRRKSGVRSLVMTVVRLWFASPLPSSPAAAR